MVEENILELAADVREKRAELERICDQILAEQGDWTMLLIAGSEAEKIATDGLKNAWMMLDRIILLAKQSRAAKELN